MTTVRVLIAFTEAGEWRAFGYSYDGSGILPDSHHMEDAWEWADGVGRMVWVEADIPPPVPEPVVQGVVVETGK